MAHGHQNQLLLKEKKKEKKMSTIYQVPRSHRRSYAIVSCTI